MDELARTRWWSLVGGLVLAVAGFFPLNNSDGYGHLAQGRNIVELGHVPSTDPFSLWKPTPATWHNYEWGFDLAIYAAYESVGPTGIVLLKCLVLFGLGVLLVRFGARLAPAHGAGAGAAPWLTAALVTLAIPAARFRLTERPHVLGLAFAAVLLLGLHALATDRTRRPWHVVGGLVALHVLWVNCHGSHLLGLMLTGAHAAALVRHPRLLLRVGVLLALQVAASGISPFGYGILTDAIEHVVNPEYRGIISEWEGWSPDDPGWYPIALFLQTGLLLASMRTLFRTSAATRAALFASVLLAIMAVRSVRFIGEYIVLTCPMLAAGLAPRFEGLAFRWRVAAEGAALAAALGL
ncbi:MAG: hypothetical protein KC417_15970, partial [Myxococcales bacterium]|nr:hypothetical protein [Myxococcales bacterium]